MRGQPGWQGRDPGPGTLRPGGPATCPRSAPASRARTHSHRRSPSPGTTRFPHEVTFAFPPPPSPGDQRRRRARGRFLGSGHSGRSQTFAPGLGLHHPHHTGREAPAPCRRGFWLEQTPPPGPFPRPSSPDHRISVVPSLCPATFPFCLPRLPRLSVFPLLEEGWLIWRAKCPLCLPGTGFGICC